MVKAKIERYWNDFRRKDETMSFTDLAELEGWIFNQMQQNYVKERSAMSFPTPEAVERIGVTGPWSIEFCPKWGGEEIWIHQIETPDGIIFSDGKFTVGHKHWTSEVKCWLTHCEERCRSPKFNFVEDESHDRTYIV